MTILLILFNNQKTILKTIKSVILNDYKKPFNLIVIDNNSKDDSLNTLINYLKSLSFRNKKKLNKILIKKNHENIGFAKAVNLGYKIMKEKTDSASILLLNPDVLLHKKCLVYLEKGLKQKKSLAVSAKIYKNKKKEIWFNGGKIDFIKFKTKHQKTSKSDYLPGCVLLISKKAFEINGLFDEQFFIYYEDCDFFYRLKKKNKKFHIENKALAIHKESQSSTNFIKNYYLVLNSLIFFKKHYPKIFLWYFWLIYYLRLFYHINISKKKAVIRALADFKRRD